MSNPDLDDPRRCKARRTRDGGPCMKWAIKGGTVCPSHGGRAPQVKAAAAQRAAEQEARRRATSYGHPITVNPLAALVEELHRTAGHVAWIGATLADLDRQKLPTSTWLALYAQERAHLARVARDCVSAGVEERLVKIEETKAELIAQAFRGLAVDLGHDPSDPMVRAAFRRHLALVRGQNSEA